MEKKPVVRMAYYLSHGQLDNGSESFLGTLGTPFSAP